MEFYWSERIRTPFVSWFLSSEEFWPNIRSDLVRFKSKRQISEGPDSRKYLEIRLNFLRNIVELRVFELLRKA